MGSVNRRRYALLALGALILFAGIWALLPTQSSDQRTTPSSGQATTTSDGGPTCRLAALPAEAADTVRLIHSNGPFPFPRNDGVVFDNRERHLPTQAKGYYREYTVITPGAHNRSTRRIITGGAPTTNPRQYFYTDDHYDSFCLVVDAGGQR
jgi:guanyl-specific ribonuclease Sa